MASRKSQTEAIAREMILLDAPARGESDTAAAAENEASRPEASEGGFPF